MWTTCGDAIAGAAGARMTEEQEFSESVWERLAGIDILLGAICNGVEWPSVNKNKENKIKIVPQHATFKAPFKL